MQLVWLGCAWLAGVALGPGALDWWPVVAVCVAALVALGVLYPEWRRPLAWAAILVAVLTLGAWRAGQARAEEAADLPVGEIEAVRGVVAGWPERGNRGAWAPVTVEEVRIGGEWRGGTARVRADTPLYPPLWRGDRVELYGYYRPVEEIGLAGFRDSLRRRGLPGQFRAFGLGVAAGGSRDGLEARREATVARIEGALRRHMPQPEAALTAGILLGDAGLLPTSAREAFNATGTAHVMALSGWNIAMVAGLCALVGRRLGRERTWYWLAGSAALVWLYTYLVGGGPTIVRAAIMGTLYLLASASGRRGDALVALVVAAVAMTAAAPATLLDLGFQLSCAATAGLVLLAGPLARALAGRGLPPLLAEGLAATVTAELFTLPLSLHYFGRLSTVNLPANLLVEPLVPLVMLGGVLTALAGVPGGVLGDAVGLVAWLPARLLLAVVEGLGSLPWATAGVPVPARPVVVALYAALGLGVSAGVWRPGALVALAAGRRAVVGGGRARSGLAPLLLGLLGGLAAAAWIALLLG